MMLTTSLRPFHVLDASLAAELEDMFFDAVDSVLPSHSSFSSSVPRGQQSQQEKRALSTTTSWRGRQVQTRETNRGTMVKMNVPGVSARDVKVTLTGGCLRDSSKKEDESKLLSSIGVPTSLRIDFLGDEQQQAERGGGNVITIKLKRKATYDIENAKGLVCDGVLRVVVPKITLPKVDVKVASGEAERPPAEESEVTLKFAVAGYSSSDISVELDAERERLKIFGELKDKSSQFERVVPVPRGLRAEHVTLCAVENGVLELRLRDPLAIEKRIVPVFSTSPPPLPSSPPSQEVAAQVNQPMMTPTTMTGSEEEKKPTEQQDNRVVLMKTEVPGYSAKDIECCINVDRTIEAKRSNGRGVKIGIPNSINVDSIKAYCEHGIFQVLGETEPPFTPRSVAVDIAGPSKDAEKQKMLKQLEDMMVEEEEEEENDAVLVNEKEGVGEEKKTSA
ncbi:unnamed protein product [Bathycoccus prasinos]